MMHFFASGLYQIPHRLIQGYEPPKNSTVNTMQQQLRLATEGPPLILCTTFSVYLRKSPIYPMELFMFCKNDHGLVRHQVASILFLF